MNTRLMGAMGEQAAARYLRSEGYKILSANYRTYCGEIDIIAQKGGFICFVEVKTRTAGGMYSPADAVGASKQKNITDSALIYMGVKKNGLTPRFDIIEVTVENEAVSGIRHIEGAF